MDCGEARFTALIKRADFRICRKPPKVVQGNGVTEASFIRAGITDRLPSTSFFFIDLDFYGEKELVTTEIANGQRWRNTYRVYQPDKIGRRNDEITDRVPFKLLDSASRIDLKERTIRIFNSSSAQEYEEQVYKFDGELNRYHLIKHLTQK